MTAEDEVLGLAADLIRFDTTNTDDPAAATGERPAAEYVAAKLSDAGYDVAYLESAPGRANVVARLPGAEAGRPALLVHGHLDVVPADAAEWSVHPFAGEVRDGYLWGRGAVDMKGMVAMTVAVASEMRAAGVVPPRDVVFAFLADEEAGGVYGARWLVRHHRGLFEGVTEAIGEVGGFSVLLKNDIRAYLVETAEKGPMHLTLRARGTAGHASLPQPDNPVAKLAAALARLAAHRFPTVLTEPVRELLTRVGELTGDGFDPADPDAAADRLGTAAGLVRASLRDTATPTMLSAGYKANVVPSVAEATVDARVLPGREAAFMAELADVLGPDIEVAARDMAPLLGTFDGPLVDALAAAVRAEDPAAHVLPYLLPASTDAKAFRDIGVRHLGFTPLRLPPGLDFAALFHGVDERVPVDALRFGVRVLNRLLRTC